MELPFTPQQEAQLAGEAVDRLLKDDTHFRAAVRDGFAAIDRGDFIEEEEMDARVSRALQS